MKKEEVNGDEDGLRHKDSQVVADSLLPEINSFEGG